MLASWAALDLWPWTSLDFTLDFTRALELRLKTPRGILLSPRENIFCAVVLRTLALKPRKQEGALAKAQRGTGANSQGHGPPRQPLPTILLIQNPMLLPRWLLVLPPS